MELGGKTVNNDDLQYKLRRMVQDLLDILFHYNILSKSKIADYYDLLAAEEQRKEEEHEIEKEQADKEAKEAEKRICHFSEEYKYNTYNICSIQSTPSGFFKGAKTHRCRGRQKDIDKCPFWNDKDSLQKLLESRRNDEGVNSRGAQ